MRSQCPVRLALACLVAVCGLLPWATVARGDTWDINKEYKQQGVGGVGNRPATDFEMRFLGDIRNRITNGGDNGATNAFPDPDVQITLDNLGNTVVRFVSKIKPEDGGNIPADPQKPHHFGVSGVGEKPRKFRTTWTYASPPTAVDVPDPNMSFLFFPATGDLLVTAENLSVDTVTFSEVGYLISATEFPLESLNRTFLPPSVFLPLTALAGEYLPDEARSTTLPGLSATDFIVTFGTVAFSGASSGNPYTLTGSEWTQVSVGAAAIPEPAALTLFGIGGLGVFVYGRRGEKRADVKSVDS